MSSPDWELLAERYLLPYIKKFDKNQKRLFGEGANTEIHNLAFMVLKDANRKGDLHKYGLVRYAQKMLEPIQTLLLREGTVVKVQRGEKVFYRNNIKWTPEEINRLRELKARGMKVKNISRILNRSKASVYTKLRWLVIG
ncbi:MAG: hypothetical protein ACP5LI_07750 [Hydrogenobaculum sp.]